LTKIIRIELNDVFIMIQYILTKKVRIIKFSQYEEIKSFNCSIIHSCAGVIHCVNLFTSRVIWL